MKPARVASVLLRGLGWIVLLASGTYLLVYLYRWEWNRALISGLFFVAAEVALAASSILRRLTSLERRIDEAARMTPATAPAPSEGGDGGPFAWLSDDHLGVFVPVLLGVGVLLSAVAYAVERVAAASGSQAGDLAAQRRLRRLARPHDSLVPAATEVAVIAPAASVRFVPPASHYRRTGRVVTWAAVVVASLVLLGGAIGLLAEFTMYRPDSRPISGYTTYSMLVELREGGGDRASVVQALWLSCRENVADDARADIVATGDGRVILTVRPQVARNDDRRFVGCLEDVTLDRVRVDVSGGEDQGNVEA
jgi:hypothetical protein